MTKRSDKPSPLCTPRPRNWRPTFSASAPPGWSTPCPPQVARGRLSGTLIGSELACIEDDFDLSQVVVLGASAIARAYRTALDCLGHAAICQEADIVTLQGLELAYSSYLKVTS